ncbi:MAG: O-antigen ligase family protein [Flavobacteriaceae bacterium]|jgi:O-antigen ligase|nr:O-antigen ligase family protein [Flavobacteriaceae bacterium]
MNWRKVYSLLFLIGLFFLPFNSIEGYKVLSIFKKEGSAYFWLPAIGILCTSFILLRKKIELPLLTKSYKVFILFILFAMFSTLLNSGDIADHFFKQKSGFHMFGVNLFMLLFAGVGIVALVLNSFKGIKVETAFLVTRRVLFYSFLFVFTYALLQFSILRLRLFDLEAFYYSLDILPFVKGHLYYNTTRLHSVSFEVPALGTYLIFIAGWMFSYILTHKSIGRFLPFMMVLLLVYLCGARSALLSIIPQILIVLFLYKPLRVWCIEKKRLLLAISCFALFLFGFVKGKEIYTKWNNTTLEQLVGDSVSNKSRIGMQVASLHVFCDSPIYGVGLGQETYSKMKYYPAWAVRDNNEFTDMYLNETDRMYPPAFNVYTKILAEMGIIGFLLFTAFLGAIIREIYYLLSETKGIHQTISIALLISLVGLMVNWAQNDDYMLYGFWISYAFVMLLIKNSSRDEVY